MSKFLVIESRDPYDFNTDAFLDELYTRAKNRDTQISVFYLQNAVLPLRKGARHSEKVSQLASQGVEILADEFSLHERGIRETVAEVKVSDFRSLVKKVTEEGVKTFWH